MGQGEGVVNDKTSLLRYARSGLSVLIYGRLSGPCGSRLI